MRTILHVDMDAFYTSVEQRDHPEYRGRPVVVGADPKGGRGRGVVAAASYEARKFGVRSALPIARAYQLCPQAIYLPPDMAKYARVSERIMEVLRGFTDLVEPLSIDEAFLDVSGSLRLHGSGREIAQAIKKRIREAEQLSCSIGIAPNKFLAKVASDLSKPEGLIEVRPGEEESFLRELPVERLWGVGPKTAQSLHELGLRTIGDLARLSEPDLAERFGKHGQHLYQLARGRDPRPVVCEHEAKSIGHETTFAEDTGDAEELRATLLELAQGVARRLRAQRLLGRTITLKFRDEDFVTRTRARTLSEPTDDGRVLYETARDLLERLDSGGKKVRLLGISAGKLESLDARPRQLGLFDSRGEEDRSRKLNRTVDALVERFGDGALTRGSLVRKEKPDP
jgi:nucleotidyltransferase/DNA polymerase involved in DNA repair